VLNYVDKLGAGIFPWTQLGDCTDSFFESTLREEKMQSAREQEMLVQIASLAGAINKYKVQQERHNKRHAEPVPLRPAKKPKIEQPTTPANDSEKALLVQIASLAGKINKHKQKTEQAKKTCKYSFSKRYSYLNNLRRRCMHTPPPFVISLKLSFLHKL